MSTNNLVDIPKYVDSQQQVLFWELDEFMPISLVFVAGIALHHLTYALVFIWPVSRFFARWKDARLDGALTHLAYKNGLPLNKIFKSPHSEWIA